MPVSVSDVQEWIRLTVGLIDEFKKINEQHRPLPSRG